MDEGDLQRRQHVSGRDAIYPDTRMRPFHGQRTGQMADSRFGGIVGRLRLRNIDNGATHTSDKDNTSWRSPLHEMPRDARGEEVGAVDVDAPEFLHAFVGVFDCVEVFGEACGSHEVVDFAVGGDDGGEGVVDGGGRGDVGVVRGDFGNVLGARVFGAEGRHEDFGLVLGFFHYLFGSVSGWFGWRGFEGETHSSNRQWRHQHH